MNAIQCDVLENIGNIVNVTDDIDNVDNNDNFYKVEDIDNIAEVDIVDNIIDDVVYYIDGVRRANRGVSCDPRSQKLFELAEIIWQNVQTIVILIIK